jgi:hypothetical protein
MSNWTEADLHQQFHLAASNGWIPFFETAAKLHGFDIELLLALASRETNMRNIKGDLRNGIFHGYGIMQIDIGSFPDFCRAWTPEQVQPSIEFGTQVLAGKRSFLAKHGITDLRAITSAYNTGEGNVLKSHTNNQDVDSTTAGGNYGQDVLNRMVVFAKLLIPVPQPQPAPVGASTAVKV